jgi:hypothetical protein
MVDMPLAKGREMRKIVIPVGKILQIFERSGYWVSLLEE